MLLKKEYVSLLPETNGFWFSANRKLRTASANVISSKKAKKQQIYTIHFRDFFKEFQS